MGKGRNLHGNLSRDPALRSTPLSFMRSMDKLVSLHGELDSFLRFYVMIIHTGLFIFTPLLYFIIPIEVTAVEENELLPVNL